MKFITNNKAFNHFNEAHENNEIQCTKCSTVMEKVATGSRGIKLNKNSSILN